MGYGKGCTYDSKRDFEKYKINATIRREMGRDINGACGQLRNEAMSQRKEDLE